MAKHSKDATVAFDDSKWRAESDCHTLIEAEKIKRDPKRFQAAKKCAAEKAKEMKAMADAAASLAKRK